MIGITEFFVLLVNALAVAVIAVVYINILAYEKILNWWFVFGAKFSKYWFWKPIWYCEKCFAGQFALWLYLFVHIRLVAGRFYFFEYNILSHLFFVLMSLFLAQILKNISFKQGWL